MPAKPPDIIVERWLPYKKQKRKVIYEKVLPNIENVTSLNNQMTKDNFIMKYFNYSNSIEKQIQSLNITDFDQLEQNTTSKKSQVNNIGKENLLICLYLCFVL